MPKQKQWWAPLWIGLVVDEQATHYRKMKNALWLFLYLMLNADRKTGRVMRKLQTICTDMGLERNMVFRWLKILRQGDYIETINNGRSLEIQIKKWKSVQMANKQPLQPVHFSSFRSGISLTSTSAGKGQNVPFPCQKSDSVSAANERSFKRVFKKIDIDKKKSFFDRIRSDPAKPVSREELLALDLAEGLGDQAGLPLYRSYAKKYPEAILREVLSTIRQIPDKQIKKSRGALFNYLIKKQDEKTTNRAGP